MRQWMLDVRCLCRQHLLGEHNEMHAFIGHGKLKRKCDGYINANLMEPLSINKRHEELAQEMSRRGYNHMSPLIDKDEIVFSYLPEHQFKMTIDRILSKEDLLGRCPICRKNFEDLEKETPNGTQTGDVCTSNKQDQNGNI